MCIIHRLHNPFHCTTPKQKHFMDSPRLPPLALRTHPPPFFPSPAPMLVVGKDFQRLSKMAASVEATGHAPAWLSIRQTNAKYK